MKRRNITGRSRKKTVGFELEGNPSTPSCRISIDVVSACGDKQAKRRGRRRAEIGVEVLIVKIAAKARRQGWRTLGLSHDGRSDQIASRGNGVEIKAIARCDGLKIQADRSHALFAAHIGAAVAAVPSRPNVIHSDQTRAGGQQVESTKTCARQCKVDAL